MARGKLDGVVRDLCRLASQVDSEERGDGQLLADFAARRDQRAFGVLVRRHGPMVFGVCRRLLRRTQDAEDAFQATFLVLVRKAAALGQREILGNWLYGVAYHTALKVRAAATRFAKETTVPRASRDEQDRETLDLLDQELNSLPEHHRAPLVLCDLGGKTYAEAARQLGCPEGTLASRLARARHLLARRLKHRGVTLSLAALAVTVVPARLTAATIRFAGGMPAARVLALTDAVMKTWLLSKLRVLAALALMVTALGALGFAVAAREEIPAATPEPLLGARPTRATLRGRIVWGGASIPGPRQVPVGATAIVATNPNFDDSRGLLKDDILTVDPRSAGLKNVFVYLLPDPSTPLPTVPPPQGWEPFVVDVTHGVLQPRAIAVRVGQTVVLTNNAGHGQNLRWLGDGAANPDGMADVPAGGTFRLENLQAQKLPLTLESTRFGWIKGRIGVFKHPYFAVTGDDGTFALRDLPAGRHRLMIYHEDLGYRLGARGKNGEEILLPSGGVTNLGNLPMGP
jgi:RNA polymerase sigma factor (sigma-70 family)